MKQRRPSITVGLSGGSGAIYAWRLLELLPRFYDVVNVIPSSSSRQVFRQEIDRVPPSSGIWKIGDNGEDVGRIEVWGPRNYNAPFASGSNCAEQMIIIPCSMSTIASIAHGVDQNVMHHAAGVTLKEGKELIVVPRETPLSAIHLRNLTTLAELGVAVVPAMPGFYGGEKTFDDLIDFVVQKIVRRLGLPIELRPRWGAEIAEGDQGGDENNEESG